MTSKEYRDLHKEELAEKGRIYREKNREKERERVRAWKKNNAKHVSEYNKKYLKEYLKSHKKQRSYYYKKENKHDLLGTCGIGRKYELLALKILKGASDCNKNSFSGKWDIEWSGFKIDVKMRNIRKTGYHFTTKRNPIADYYLLFCVIGTSTEKILLVPKEVFRTSLYVATGLHKKTDNYRLNVL